MEEKDEVSYCLIYDILCFQKDSELLRAWHEELLPLKENFSENTYNSMIQAFFRHKLFDEGMIAFRELIDRFCPLETP